MDQRRDALRGEKKEKDLTGQEIPLTWNRICPTRIVNQIVFI